MNDKVSRSNGGSRSAPSGSQRRTIALATFGFIFLSAFAHMILGGVGALPRWPQPQPTASPYVIIDERVLRTPAPTPTPTPTPTALPSPVHRNETSTPTRHPPRPVTPTTPHASTDTRATIGPEFSPGPPSTSTPGLQTAEPSPVPETPVPQATIVDARDMIIDAVFLRRCFPNYPDIARQAGWEGTVIVLVTIGPDGVEDARIGATSGYPVLDRAALETAKECKYRPPEVNGKPAVETYRIIYTFTLNDGAF